MSTSRFEFFATAEDQKEWLIELMRDGIVWCVVRETQPTPRVELQDSSDFVRSFSFVHSARGMTQFFLGLREFCESPVWEKSAASSPQINFTRSQAICFDPSLTAGDSILLQGQAAIMREVYYREAGIDPRPVREWYRSVVKKFKASKAPNATVIQHTTLGTTKEWGSILATSGAAAWWKSGRKLKQFVNGPVEFDLRTSTPEEPGNFSLPE